MHQKKKDIYQGANKKLHLLLTAGVHEMNNDAFLPRCTSTACLYTDEHYIRACGAELKVHLTKEQYKHLNYIKLTMTLSLAPTLTKHLKNRQLGGIIRIVILGYHTKQNGC